mmetsp:Transcript_24139/g.66895  ORF Transcript_24139/g.66895 Transcript_24139/m.66895 type:complete len:335 (+) Transcript_24139:318-1322(+)
MNSKQIPARSLLAALCLGLILALSFGPWPCEAKTKSETESKSKSKPAHEKYKNMCRGLPTIKKQHESHLQQLFRVVGETKITGNTPQNEAACWMFRQKRNYNAQRYALAVVYYSSKGAQWDINTNWMTSKHECTWHGVTCNMFGTVIELDLGYIELEGLIPRELGLLGSLRDLDLHGNDLQGVIPHRLLNGMKNGQYLRLQMNGLFGSIHREIMRMKNLKELYLFGNFFAGTIPKQLSELKKLEIVDLYANQLTGTIPKELATLPKLKYLDLHDNNLVGTMPKEICDKKLETLVADCHGKRPEVKCDCCTVCCEGLPVLSCFDPKTGQQVTRPI